MISIDVVITNRLGLHARAAARFVHLASSFRSNVKVVKDDTEIDGKSILGILTLAAILGTKLSIVCQGDDEGEASQRLAELIEQKFGEDA